MVLNALAGAFIFEKAWAHSKRHREINEERDKHFPAWRRFDAPKWKKWQFYPFAVTILIPRIILGVACLMITVAVNTVMMVGLDLKKPIPTWRRNICKMGYAVGNGLASLVFGMITIPTWPDTDYS